MSTTNKPIQSWHKQLLNFLYGESKFRNAVFPNMMLIGIVAVILLYVSVAGLVSVTAPWTVRGDTRQHIDYVWQLYDKHQIPTFKEGIKYPPFIKIWGFKKQGVAANPPLFYLIHAPFEGPLLARGRWQAAIGLGRIINILIGVLCVPVLAWAGWLYGGKHKALMAVAIPSLSVLLYRFTQLNVDFALDGLLVLLSTLSLIVDYKLIKNGLTKKYLLWLTILSVFGMATKAPYIVFLGTSCLAVVLAGIVHGKKSLKHNTVRGLLIVLGISLLALVAAGWFYYLHNFRNSGKWFGSSPNGYTGGRTYKSFFNVITSQKYWALIYGDYASSQTLSLAVFCFAVAGMITITKDRLLHFFKDRTDSIVIGLLILSFLGTFAVQTFFAIGYGAINFRYLLPAIMPIGLFLAFGLVQFSWTRAQLVSASALAVAGLTVFKLGSGHLGPIYAQVKANNLNLLIPRILIVLFLLGTVLLPISLFIVSNPKFKTSSKKSASA